MLSHGKLVLQNHLWKYGDISWNLMPKNSSDPKNENLLHSEGKKQILWIHIS